jgi:hypothetical protein
METPSTSLDLNVFQFDTHRLQLGGRRSIRNA